MIVDIAGNRDDFVLVDGFGRISHCQAPNAGLYKAMLIGVSSDGRHFVWQKRFPPTDAVLRPDVFIRVGRNILDKLPPGEPSYLMRYRQESGIAVCLQRREGNRADDTSWHLSVANAGSDQWRTVNELSFEELPDQLSLTQDGNAVLSRNDEIIEVDIQRNQLTTLGSGRHASMSADGRFLSRQNADNTLSILDLQSQSDVFSSNELIEGGVEWSPHLPFGIVRVKHRWLLTPKLMSARSLFVVNPISRTWQRLCAYNLGYGTLTIRWLLTGVNPCDMFQEVGD